MIPPNFVHKKDSFNESVWISSVNEYQWPEAERNLIFPSLKKMLMCSIIKKFGNVEIR